MDDKLKCRCFDFIGDTNQIEFWDASNNVYATKSLSDGKCKIESFMGIDSVANKNFSSIEKYKDMIIFAPGSENEVLIYYKKEQYTKSIVLDSSKVYAEGVFLKFCKIVVWDEKIYLFPHAAIAIVVIDINTYEVEYIEDWYEKNNIKKGEWTFCDFGYRVAEKCFLPFSFHNKVLCFDLKTRQHKIYDVGNVVGGFEYMISDGEYVWLAGLFVPYLYKWNVRDNTMISFNLNWSEETEKGFIKLFIIDNKMILIPSRGRSVWIWDMRENSKAKCINLPIYNQEYEEWGYFWCIKEIADNILCGYSIEMQKILTIDIETGVICEHSTEYLEEDKVAILDRICREREVNLENELINIEYLIESVKGNRNITNKDVSCKNEQSSDKYLIF